MNLETNHKHKDTESQPHFRSPIPLWLIFVQLFGINFAKVYLLKFWLNVIHRSKAIFLLNIFSLLY